MSAGPQIQDISVRDDAGMQVIDIEADRPMTFTLYKPSDPFRAVLEIASADLGNLTDRILIDRDAIFEIIPEQVTTPAPMARIEIGLTAPLDISPRAEGTHLYLEVPKPTLSDSAGMLGEESQPVAMAAADEDIVQPESGSVPTNEIPEAQPLDKYPVPSSSPTSIVPALGQGQQPGRRITDISVEDTPGQVLVQIKTDGNVLPKVYDVADKNRLVIDLPDVASDIMGSVERVVSPVKAVRTGRYKNNARVVIDFYGETTHEVTTSANGVVVSVDKKIFEAPSDVTEGESSPAVQQGMSTYGEAPAGGTTQAVAEVAARAKKGEETKRITLNFQNHDVVPIYRLLARVGGYNLVVHPEVKGTIPDLYLEDVPWDQALDIVLRLAGHGKQVEGNILRIAPHEVFAREYEQVAKNRDAEVKAADLVEVTIPINYAEASKVQDAIDQSKILTPRGNITVDERMNTLIIKDTQDGADRVAELVKKMDVPKKQVMIEARMVTVRTGLTRSLGINWFATYTNAPPLAPFVSDTVAQVATNVGLADAVPNIDMLFGTLADNINLEVMLAAIETTDDGKTLSNPRVTTMDNEAAVVKQGTKIPYQTRAEDGAYEIKFMDATLSLTVTPRITPGGYVQMKILATRNFRSYDIPNVGSAIAVNEVDTNALVKDGETIVLGGIYTKDETEGESRIPLLGRIPVIGWLFKAQKTTDTVEELLIFVTPRVVEEGRPT